MTPEELKQNYRDACYYYMADGNPSTIFYNFESKCVLYKINNQLQIVSWSSPKPQPDDSDLAKPTIQQLKDYCIQRDKNIRISDVKNSLAFPLIKNLYEALELDIEESMRLLF